MIYCIRFEKCTWLQYSEIMWFIVTMSLHLFYIMRCSADKDCLKSDFPLLILNVNFIFLVFYHSCTTTESWKALLFLSISRQNSITVNTKGHSRHHSYPLYVPGNPMHNPPPAPTPPRLDVHQEQLSPFSMSKSYNHLDSYTNMYTGEGYYSHDARSVHMNIGTSNVSYGCGYPSFSQGSVDASAAVDLGSPGVGGPAGSKGSWLGWIRGTVSNVGHRVAEKAKNSMDTMITTLDPQMKEFIRKYILMKLVFMWYYLKILIWSHPCHILKIYFSLVFGEIFFKAYRGIRERKKENTDVNVWL